MRIVILVVLAIFGLAAVACTSETPSPVDTQTASPPTPDVPATVEAGVIATREAETAIDATVEATVAAALTAPTPTTAPMPTAAPQPTPNPTPTMAEYAPDDHGNDFEGATRIAIGESVAFELENYDDIDVLVFRARPGTAYVLSLNWEYYIFRESSTERPLLAVYSANGQEHTRLTGYDLHESGVPSIGLVWRAVTGGDYYIVIGDGNTEGASAFSISEGEALVQEATPAPTAQAPTPASSFVSVSAGGEHTCGVSSDGSVACWGSDYSGQATPPAGSFDSVSAGLFHTCGVKSDGSVACWGSDENGQATPPAGSFVSVSAGDYHTCGVRSTGSVACWGSEATAPVGSFVSVSAGAFHTCGVMGDGSVACWGDDEYGTTTPPAGSFVSVSAGGEHTCGVKSDGSVACWGSDYYGETTPPAGSFDSVSAGYVHTCGVKSDGSVACWGDNYVFGHYYGQATPPAGSFTSVSAGVAHTCGLRSDGSVACWGYAGAPQPTPTPAPTMAEYAPDDHGNDFEGATRIAIGEAVAFELENYDDIDVLVFRARPGTEFLLTLNWEYYEFRENYTESPLLAVYSANGQEQTRLMGYDLFETGGSKHRFGVASCDRRGLLRCNRGRKYNRRFRILHKRGGSTGTRSHSRSDRASPAAREFLRLR